MGPVRLQFGKQEPADNPAIKKFAEGKGFTGPVFAKIDVNGANGEQQSACLVLLSGLTCVFAAPKAGNGICARQAHCSSEHSQLTSHAISSRTFCAATHVVSPNLLARMPTADPVFTFLKKASGDTSDIGQVVIPLLCRVLCADDASRSLRGLDPHLLSQMV